ncbi:staphylopine family metallophore export MFS transporter CntE [Bacillus mesophilum]|uniref:MFS transporter n=1 Tax=Bacillus mesophilum TaxID=1071718 RepID=A0A7V7UWW6_9BACI|nr:MFS transporter [Bacillus mesophilum]KAB2331716.1 MFS transporter [Bacillus mesophilum]
MSGAMSWPFLRLYLLVLLYFSANSLLNVIIPLQGGALGATNTTIGLIMGAYLFTTMLFRPWAGQVIQKFGPIKVLRIILILNGCALILYTCTGLEGYLVGRMLQGVSTAFFSMALQIGIIDALPEKDRSQGISLYSLFSYIPGIVGPFLALGIWQSGMEYFSIVMIVIAVSTGLFGYSARIDRKEKANSSNETESNIQTFASFGELYKNPHLFKCSILMLIGSIVFGAATVFVPLYADQIRNGNAGIYLGLMAITVVVCRFTLRKNIPSDGKWHSGFMMITMLLLALGSQFVSFSVTGGVVFFYIGAIQMGIAQALLYPTLTTYLSFVLPKFNRNILLGLFIAMADLGVSLGGVIMGPLADIFTYSIMYQICAIMAALMIIFSYDNRKVFVD